MKKSVCRLLAALALSLSVSGCAAAEEKEIRIECQPVEGRALQTEYVFPAEVFEGTPEPDAEHECLKLAAYPASGIDIYGVCESGRNEETLIVVWRDCSRAFDVSYMGTGGIALRSGVLDVDGDGEEELILMELLGTGTGVSVENLHVVEKSGETLSLYSLTLGAFAAPMREWMSARIDPKTGNIRIGEKHLQIPGHVGTADFAFGNMVSFDVTDGKICMDADVQFWAEGEPFRGVSDYIVELSAEVSFSGQAFTFSGFEAAGMDAR